MDETTKFISQMSSVVIFCLRKPHSFVMVGLIFKKTRKFDEFFYNPQHLAHTIVTMYVMGLFPFQYSI
jgi:hypothetical protein